MTSPNFTPDQIGLDAFDVSITSSPRHYNGNEDTPPLSPELPRHVDGYGAEREKEASTKPSVQSSGSEQDKNGNAPTRQKAHKHLHIKPHKSHKLAHSQHNTYQKSVSANREYKDTTGNQGFDEAQLNEVLRVAQVSLQRKK